MREEFGARDKATGAAAEEARAEAEHADQRQQHRRSSASCVQYVVKDAFAARYALAEPRATLRDAAQAAVREVVGRMTIDDVLSKQRGQVAGASQELLQQILDGYGAGVTVTSIELQDVQAPEPVRAAFDDVVGAAQDADRLVNEAEGYRNEILPGARAEAVELIEGGERLPRGPRRRGDRRGAALPGARAGVPQGAGGDARSGSTSRRWRACCRASRR